MSTTLFTNARIATLDDEDTVLEGTDVLVSDGVITEVATGIAAPEGAEVIDATGMLLMPGMADTHNHLWEHLFRGRVTGGWGMEYYINIHPLGSSMDPEEIYAGVYAGSIECLYAGVTSVYDYNHTILSPEHAEASVQALQDAGIRGTLCYDLVGRDPSGRSTYGPSSARFGHIEDLANRLGDGRVRVGVGLSMPKAGRQSMLTEEVEFARSLGLPMTFHNNNGGEIGLLDEWGLLGPDILPAHGNWITNDELDALARAGGYLSVTPEVESFGGRRALTMTGRGHARGVKIALGVDVPALTNLGLINQMRYAFLLERVFEGINERIEGHVPVARRPGVPGISLAEMLRFSTRHGVEALGQGGSVGQVTPGYRGDLVLIDARSFGMAEGHPASQVIFHSSYGDIDTVLVDGEVRKRDAALVGVDLAAMNARSQEVRKSVLSKAGPVGEGSATRAYWDWVPDQERV